MGSCKLNSGRYELLEPARRRRQEKCSRLRKDAMQLAVQGSAVKLRKPRKNECPNGPDAIGDPRYDAAVLLSSADVALEGDDGAAQGIEGTADGGSGEESEASSACLD